MKTKSFQNPLTVDFSVPPNLVFEIDDLEEPWTFSFKFNYIHSKMMAGAFQDWKRFYQQSYEYVLPQALHLHSALNFKYFGKRHEFQLHCLSYPTSGRIKTDQDVQKGSLNLEVTSKF